MMIVDGLATVRIVIDRSRDSGRIRRVFDDAVGRLLAYMLLE